MPKLLRPILFAVLLMLPASASPGRAQDRVRVIAGSPQNQMRVVNTYPEYWVDGKPFFQYAGAFFYYRLPRDRWAEEMLALKDMGLKRNFRYVPPDRPPSYACTQLTRTRIRPLPDVTLDPWKSTFKELLKES